MVTSPTPGRPGRGPAAPARRPLTLLLVAGLLGLMVLAGCSSTSPTRDGSANPDRSIPSSWHNFTATRTIDVDHAPCTDVCITSFYSETIAPLDTATTTIRVRLTWSGDPPCGELMVRVGEIKESVGPTVALYRGKPPLVFELSNITLIEATEPRTGTRLHVSAGHASWSSTPVTALNVTYTLESAALVHPLQDEDWTAENRTARGPDQGLVRC